MDVLTYKPVPDQNVVVVYRRHRSAAECQSSPKLADIALAEADCAADVVRRKTTFVDEREQVFGTGCQRSGGLAGSA